MSITLENSIISKINIGSANANRVYVGNTLIHGKSTNPLLDMSNLIVYLNGSTITDGTNVLTATGSNVVDWKNQITGNGVSGASQSTGSRQPTLQITNGVREVSFDGTDDVLTFFSPSELDFQKTQSFTIVVLTGLNSLHGYLVNKGLQTDKQYSVWLLDDALDCCTFGDEQPGNYVFPTTPTLPTDPILVTYSFDTSDDTQKLWYNNVYVTGSNVTSNILFPLNDTIIGARNVTAGNNNTYGYHFTGAIREVLIFDKMLNEDERTLIYSNLML